VPAPFLAWKWGSEWTRRRRWLKPPPASSAFRWSRSFTGDIELPGDRTLYDLAEAIVRAYGFGLDHAFGFFPKLTGNIYDAKPRYELFADMGESDGSLSVKRTAVSQAFPKVGRKMTFLFDYGDEWLFRVELVGMGQKVPRARYPKIFASVGQAPEQYPDMEDEEEE
jgi:hypothetical protein